MGVFDYIRVHQPLPDWPGPQDWKFQTKDTNGWMSDFEIREDGTLWEEVIDFVELPPEERPYPPDHWLHDISKFRREHLRWVRVPFHGDIYFYTNYGKDEAWYEYRARFTEDVLSRITRVQD